MNRTRIVVSLLVEPIIQQVKAAAKVGSDYIELHLGQYANADDLNAGLHEAHHIENGIPRVRIPAGRIDEHPDRFIASVLQQYQLANDPLGEILIDLSGEQNIAGLQCFFDQAGLGPGLFLFVIGLKYIRSLVFYHRSTI